MAPAGALSRLARRAAFRDFFLFRWLYSQAIGLVYLSQDGAFRSSQR